MILIDLVAQGKRMSAPKYSLCKHGPNCYRHSVGKCGFAHSLEEVSWPQHVLYSRHWVDESHVWLGHPAPDIFVGQKYTYDQLARILSYVARKDPPYPPWVDLYLWLLKHPKFIPDHRRDLGWYSSVKELWTARLLGHNCMRSFNDAEDARGLLQWKAPWVYCKDLFGKDFRERMKYRLEHAVEYPLYKAIYGFTAAEWHRNKTSMHWSRYSKDYLNVTVGEHFVFLEEAARPHEGWAWVAKYTDVEVYGWVPLVCLESTNKSVILERARSVQVSEEQDIDDYVSSSCPLNLAP